ncbi:MAG: hypothetical protein LBT14_13930 [Treponema sp.]|nr:hypothetical protein [Treponema sp.]
MKTRLETENADNTALLLDNYLGLMKGLSRENKIQLVAKLTREIAEEKDDPNKMDLVDKFCGVWQSEKSADEIVAEMRADRTFTRTLDSF